MGIGGNFVKAMLEVLSDAVEYILNSKEITRLGKGEL